ncbi:MAG: M18 family aminopeptidase [Bacilli bacterium]
MKEFINFLKEAHTTYQTVEIARTKLADQGFKELDLSNPKIEKGNKYYIIKNDGAILAFKVGTKLDTPSIQIVASHNDSPMLKIKPKGIITSNGYTKINSEVYGGLILSTFVDRPLGIAGRVIVSNDGALSSKVVTLNQTQIIPNLAIHMNREINNGFSYNPQIDMQAILGLSNTTIKSILEKELGLTNIVDYDLFLYNKEEPMLAGSENELILSPRLDNLECFYASLKAFIEGENENNINIWVGFNHEEVGSSSNNGAASSFLKDIIDLIISSLNLESIKPLLYQNTMLISADNAHAVHPNHPEKSDPENAVFMNKGIVIKYNSNLSYTTDALSGSIFKQLCNDVNIPYQEYTNRSDIRGGGTLGCLLLRSVSVISVDIGLAQLAMHSAYETAGTHDFLMMQKVLTHFYNRHLNATNPQKITLK